MQNPLALKLKHFAQLSESEIRAVEELSGDVVERQAGSDLLRQGDKPDTVMLIVEGLACRYKITEAGDRQIVGIMVPGDLCDLHAFILDEMDHSIAALTLVRATAITKAKLLDLFDQEPRITRALWWSTLVDEGTLREWVMNIATRSGHAALAHLLSEICMRLQMVGLAGSTECEIKMRQEDLADAVGVGRSHASSLLAQLKSDGIVDYTRGTIRILDLRKLNEAAKFNRQYLHLAK